MRKLASIQIVNTVEPIPGADSIERIRLLGWWVVVKKGEFAVGDKVVYCEIDSLLPERPEFEFLRASSYKPAQSDGTGREILRAGFRIKTVRLRGQVSQGICFPTTLLPSGTSLDEGIDLTQSLDIVKWEPPLPVGMGGQVKGAFPGFLSKTDETRVQLLEDVLRRHRGKTLYLTEKLDGTSFSAYLHQEEYGVCSRNLRMEENDATNLHARMAQRLQLKEKLQELRNRLGVDVALQGELVGPGIQSNKYKLAEVELFVFNLLNLAEGKLFPRGESLTLVESMGLKNVPQLGELVLQHSVDELVSLAEGFSLLNPKIPREGIVLRTECEEFDPDLGSRFSFKAINPKFLLKYDE